MKEAMQAYSVGFNAALLTCADAATVVSEAAAIEHMASTVKVLAAARAAEAKAWKTGGHRSAEEELARRTGSSVAGARDALALGRRLADQPEVAGAARRGNLSPTQASAISDAVAADPAAAGKLVNAAGAGGSLADLKQQCAEVKAAADDLEARQAAIHRRRSLRSWTDSSGEWRLVAAGSPEDGAQVMAALAPLADTAFRAARRQGRREHPDAYRFDALVQLALDAISDPKDDDTVIDGDTVIDRDAILVGPGPGPRRPDSPAPSGRFTDVDKGTTASTGKVQRARRNQRRGRGAPVKLLIRVDLTTLLRGFPTNGETCELVGYGPIAVSTINDLLTHANPFIAAILTKGKQLAGVAHLGRQPTAHQKTALQWLYPTCAAQGCPTPAQHLHIDHRIDWAHTHLTLLDWLDALCPHHHDHKTRYGWSLTNGTGKRPFVPPTDPRHPNHRHPNHHPPPDEPP